MNRKRRSGRQAVCADQFARVQRLLQDRACGSGGHGRDDRSDWFQRGRLRWGQHQTGPVLVEQVVVDGPRGTPLHGRKPGQQNAVDVEREAVPERQPQIVVTEVS